MKNMNPFPNVLIVIFLFPSLCFSQGLGNSIIQNDIGAYKFRPKPTKELYGNSGALVGAEHFDLDHDDITYVTEYILPEPILGVEVQVTQHAGGDSDRWLLHEAEDCYRDSDDDDGRLGLLSGAGVKMEPSTSNPVPRKRVASFQGRRYSDKR